MKAKLAILLAVVLVTTTQCVAQKQFTVEAQNNDISNNLDLKAVATAFGESKNLEDFERRLNDYDSGISNLDLNNDGQVDYLRVIEETERNTHVVVIQAVLGKDIYQDVASIVVDKDQTNNNTSVQVIGDPYIYGRNYIIEPAYYYTPSIYSYFWAVNYNRWNSPYYWGYYPNYYHHRSPFELNIYLSNVYTHINHDHRYYYSNTIRNHEAETIHSNISRNDYAERHPDRTFSNRNENAKNKRDFEFNRNGIIRNGGSRSDYQQKSTENNRTPRSYDSSNSTRNSQSGGWNQRNSTNNATRDNTYPNRNNNESGNRNNGWQNNDRNHNQPTSPTPTYTPSPTNNNNSNRNSDANTNSRVNQPRPRYDSGNTNNSINRNIESRPNTQLTQPRSSEQKTTGTQPAVRESRRESRDNSIKNDERK